MMKQSYGDRRLHAMLCNLVKNSPRSMTRAINILRTAFWYQRLCRATSKFTPYKVGKHLQPETYGKNEDNEAFSHNLWPKYASGVHVPSPALIDLVDQKMPGSKADFEHHLFDLFNTSRPIGRNGTELLKKLHPAIQRAIFENKALKYGVYRRRQSLVRMLGWLERCGNMDALAASIILLREAVENKQHENAFLIGESLFRTSVIACTIGPGGLIRGELGIAIVVFILPLISSYGRVYRSNSVHFFDCCDLLSDTILKLEDNYQIGMLPKDTLTAAWKILRGDYGDDLRWAMRPQTAIIDGCQEASIKMHIAITRDRLFSEWAWRSIKSGKAVSFIPTTMLIQLSEVSKQIRTRAIESDSAPAKEACVRPCEHEDASVGVT